MSDQANTDRERGRPRGTSSTRSSVGSSTSPTQSEPSTSRGRGRPRGFTKRVTLNLLFYNLINIISLRFLQIT